MAARAQPEAADSTEAPPWRAGFEDLRSQHGFVSLSVQGELPPELRGVLYRAGPALYGFPGRRYGHPLDGDGAVSAVRFGAGEAQGAVRVVQTEGWRRERAAGRPLYGGWGTPVPGPMRGFQRAAKNPANTSVLVHRGRLFALYEGGLPTELAPDSLETLGTTDFGGAIRVSFSAHPRYCPQRRRFYNFGVRYNVVSHIDLYELGESGPVRRAASVAIPGAALIHDFAIAGDHALFLVSPVRVNLYTTAFGRKALQDNFSWKPAEGTEVLLVSLDAPHRTTRLGTAAFHAWHIVDAWTERDVLCADIVAYPDFTTNAWFGGLLAAAPNPPARATLERLTVHPGRGRVERERRWSTSCEFPVVAPAVRGQKHRYAYLLAHSSAEAARGWWDEIAKFDFDTGEAGRFPLPHGHYPSEALFVPRAAGGAEDDGWVLAPVLDARARRTRVAVWRADAPGSEPLAEAHFDHAIPFAFHGFWQPA